MANNDCVCGAEDFKDCICHLPQALKPAQTNIAYPIGSFGCNCGAHRPEECVCAFAALSFPLSNNTEDEVQTDKPA